MKKQTKQTLAALLAGVMLMGTISGCTPSAENPSPSGSGQPGPSASAGVPSGQVEELGSGTVKWSEEKTADGWMKVTNEGGRHPGLLPRLRCKAHPGGRLRLQGFEPERRAGCL